MVQFKHLKKLRSNPLFSRKFVLFCIKTKSSKQSFLTQLQKVGVSKLQRLHDIKKFSITQQKELRITFGTQASSESLEFILWRVRFFPSRLAARRAVLSKQVYVNGVLQKSSLAKLFPGDIVNVKELSTLDNSFFTKVSSEVFIEASLEDRYEVSFSTKSFVVCF